MKYNIIKEAVQFHEKKRNILKFSMIKELNQNIRLNYSD